MLGNSSQQMDDFLSSRPPSSWFSMCFRTMKVEAMADRQMWNLYKYYYYLLLYKNLAQAPFTLKHILFFARYDLFVNGPSSFTLKWLACRLTWTPVIGSAQGAREWRFFPNTAMRAMGLMASCQPGASDNLWRSDCKIRNSIIKEQEFRLKRYFQMTYSIAEKFIGWYSIRFVFFLRVCSLNIFGPVVESK